MNRILAHLNYAGNANNISCQMLHISHDGTELPAVFNADNTIALIADTSFYENEQAKKILSLYERYGENFVDHLIGAFAFIIWDKKQQKLIAVRDRLGEKSLYYAEIPCGVVIASELNKILSDYIQQPEINISNLLEPIRFTAPIEQKVTFVEQIKRLQPGEMLIVNDKGVRTRQYWRRNRSYDFRGTYEDAKTETLRLFQESVDACMTSEKRVAVMLSGGVDSSAVAALAKRSGHEVHTITAGYTGNHNCDERDVARRFANEQGFIHHEIEISTEEYKNSFEELTKWLDEPITDAAVMAQWTLFKKVKELGFDVLLGGMAGDELFYGYPAWNKLSESLTIRREHESIFPWNTAQKKRHFIEFLLKNWKHVLFAGYPSKLNDESWGWWIRDDYYRFIENATFAIGDECYSLKDFKIYKDFAPCERGKEIDLIYDDAIDTVMVMAYLYLSDRLGFGANLEVRSPLLNHKLVEFVMSLPLNMKYHKGNPKQFFKDVLQGIVPDYILYAQKRGFTPPNSFVDEIVQNYQYKLFCSDYKFYNSVLADRVLSLLLKK